jgi:DNA-binding response OmpR family regulator
MSEPPKSIHRILLVDDDESFRKMLRKTLIKLGYEVLEARNGKEAIELSDNNPVELVLTDIVMPEKEGLETIGVLRRKFPKIKIIAMSGGGRGSASDYLKVAKMMGANRVIVKPFSYEQISAVVAGLLGTTESQ